MPEKPWSIVKPPPENHEEVGSFVLGLFLRGEEEKQRLGLPARWLENHRLYRGGSVQGLKSKLGVTANIIFANIQRTVANLTSKNPTAEVVSQDWRPVIDPTTNEPVPDDTDTVLTTALKSWWNETEQIRSLVDSTLNQEIYGITTEKGVYDAKKKKGDVVILDPFAFGCAPGNWEDLGSGPPYCYHAYKESVATLRARFGVETISADPSSSLGEERETNRPMMHNLPQGAIPSGSLSIATSQFKEVQSDDDDALVVEMWLRDYTEVPASPVLDPTTGEPMLDETGAPIFPERDPNAPPNYLYPGGIRMITVTSEGTVLVDVANPNINLALWNDEETREGVENTYLFDHLPFWYANSYRDPSSFWGFGAAEQVGVLAEQIGEILSRMHKYLGRMLLPTLILPKDCGVTPQMINNNPGLILQPTTGALGAGIKYLETPSLPADTMRLYQLLLTQFDRVYQIEDADRGDTPNRIVAASAIVALQERNQVLMRHKIRSVDFLIRQRGRASISFLQNFGFTSETIKVDDDSIAKIVGIDLLGRKFSYVVESGSTVPQTSLQVKELALDLAKMNRIDTRALLETLQFPGWRQIVERMAEAGGQIEQAAQIFVAAGVPPEQVQALIALARQPQGGPGDTAPATSTTPAPEAPAPITPGA